MPEVPIPPRTHSVGTGSSRRSTRSISKLISSVTSPTRSVNHKSRSPNSSSSKSKSEEPEAFVCPICFDDSSDLKQLALNCGHVACSGCWYAYTSSKICNEGEYCIRCMAEGCALVVPDTFIRSVLFSDAPPTEANAAWTRFQELLVRNFVSSSPKLKFCPYPGCTNTVSCPSASGKSALTTMVPAVSCGARGLPGSPANTSTAELSSSSGVGSLQEKEHIFCFGCPIDTDHRPVVCGVAKMWLRKCEDDSETANWIKSNTKECTKCESTIEKNGGCKCVLVATTFSPFTHLTLCLAI